jgi:hypothetical protein
MVCHDDNVAHADPTSLFTAAVFGRAIAAPATGLNAKFCLGLEILFVLVLIQASVHRDPRPRTALLVAFAIRAWLTATLGMMLVSHALLALNFR